MRLLPPSSLLLALLLAGCGPPTPPPPDIPRPDLTGAEAPVVSAVDRAIQGVLDAPDSAEAWGRLADRYQLHGWYPEAVACYLRACALAPRDFAFRYRLAWTQLRLPDPEGCARSLEEAIRLRSDYAPAHLLLGELRLRAGELDGAEAHFRAARDLDPGLGQASFGLGQVALSRQQLKTARDEMLEAVEKNPRLREAHHALATIYYRLGDREEAERHAGLTRDLPKLTSRNDPLSLPDAKAVGSFGYEQSGLRLEREGRLGEAEAHYREALRVNDALPEVQLRLGVVLMRRGKLEAAVAALSRARELKSQDPEILTALGRALLLNGSADEAVRVLQEAAMLNPDDPYARHNLGDALRNAGRPREAAAAYEAAMRLRPDWHLPVQRLAWLLATHPDASVRDGARAVVLAREALRLEQGVSSPQTLDTLAAACAEAGDFENARLHAGQAVDRAAALGDPQLSREILERSRLYVQGRPYRMTR